MDGIFAYAITGLDGLAYGLLLFCVASGLTLIWGVADILQLGHGTLYLAGAYLGWWLADGGWGGLAAATAVGALAGAAVGGLLAICLRPLTGRHLDQGLATLGGAFVTADLLTTATGGQPLRAEAPLPGSVPLFGHLYPTWRLVFIGVAAGLATILVLIVDRSTVGATVRAVVDDEQMAAATGIRTRLVQAGVLAAGCALAVTVGVIGAPVLGPAPGVDTTVLTLSLIIVVVGGLGSIRGALLAAVGVGLLQTLGVLLAPAALVPFLLAAAMLIVLVARPTLHGRPA
ncbi:branched-subunit amino acid ABC-type transport system permease component [Hamadaea flava]|uniref:Branched-chain amino acid ABC transporter permease n=1 Tax=Hamadaea flava TaxID=1742688 RepID=A0ABV8LLD4_9ACTN|nr:branched-chain amino acid ABC transporter permease [Hamadaea flava]MCP2323562.1 branched-subunit amino acid ABC-type transport system permease component [Hamadaea flava]